MSAKVLIVEDAASVRMTLERMLEQAGIPKDRISSVDSGETALKVFAEVSPTIVFLDIELGTLSDASTDSAARKVRDISGGAAAEWDGVKVARRMLQTNPFLKIVVATGLTRDHPKVRAMIQVGVFEVIEKPLRLARIQQVLKLIEDEEQGIIP
ncbi:MAG: response regulator [Thermoplasmata archaeon]|nr:response regulator [Thermoplasmata archaeon]